MFTVHQTTNGSGVIKRFEKGRCLIVLEVKGSLFSFEITCRYSGDYSRAEIIIYQAVEWKHDGNVGRPLSSVVMSGESVGGSLSIRLTMPDLCEIISKDYAPPVNRTEFSFFTPRKVLLGTFDELLKDTSKLSHK